MCIRDSGNLGKMLLSEETECFAFLAGHESFAAAEGAIKIALNANKVRTNPVSYTHLDVYKRQSKSYTAKLDKPNVEMVWDSVVEEILENGRVCGIRVKNIKTQAAREIPLDGLFVAVGNVPATDFVRGAVELDPAGYFTAGEDTKTNLPGVFAAGDCRKKPLRQIVTAASDGAVAAYAVEEYLS